MTQELRYNSSARHLLSYLKATFAPSGYAPIYYQGAVAGSEFLTFAGTKLYMALEFSAGGSTASSAAAFSTTLYDSLNAISMYINANSGLFDTVAAANEFAPMYVQAHNFYFSRLTCSVYTHIIFKGYRLTY